MQETVSISLDEYTALLAIAERLEILSGLAMQGEQDAVMSILMSMVDEFEVEVEEEE